MNIAVQKITIWGDSVFKGVALDPKTGKYNILNQSCTELSSRETGVSFLNRARFGCTVTKGLSIMRSDLHKQLDYNVAIIEFGGNDCDFDWAKISQNPDSEYDPKTPLPQFISGIQQMVDETRANGIEPVLTTLPPIEPHRFFATISKGLNPKAIMKWLGDVFLIYRWQESYSNAIAKLAIENKCRILDFRGAFLQEKKYNQYLCDDGMHPNEKGHRLMANVLDEFLKKYINRGTVQKSQAG